MRRRDVADPPVEIIVSGDEDTARWNDERSEPPKLGQRIGFAVALHTRSVFAGVDGGPDDVSEKRGQSRRPTSQVGMSHKFSWRCFRSAGSAVWNCEKMGPDPSASRVG